MRHDLGSVLQKSTCSGDQSCCHGLLLVDTSHLTFLARAALELEKTKGTHAHHVYFDLLRATSCWQQGRLMTTTVIFNDQIDPSSDDSRVLEVLGLPSPQDPIWTDFLAVFDDDEAHALIDDRDIDAVGKHDCSLIGNGLVRSRESDTFLVTNDEDLIKWTVEKTRRVRKIDSTAAGNLIPLPSLHLCRSLVTCGAFPTEVMRACLSAEYADVHARPLVAHVRQRKLDRIRLVATELSLPQPGKTAKVDDEDVRRHFLGD